MRSSLVVLVALSLAACDGSSHVDMGMDLAGEDFGLADGGVDMGHRVDLGIDAALPRLDYTDEANWLCRPGRTDDCNSHDMTATAVYTDGGTEVLPYDAGTPPMDVDCFYLYPTADVSGAPGNHTDLTDTSPIVPELISTAVRFRGLCNLWAPLYRQATLGSFLTDPTPWMDAAYADVLAAWDEYATHLNNGHKIVLLAHSQGSFHMRRMIQDRIDYDPILRGRVIVAVLLGGDVLVPDGALVGGSFTNLPLCSSDAQTGCVIAYRSYHETEPPPNTGGFFSHVGPPMPVGQDVGCTDPTSGGTLAGSYLLSNTAYATPTLVTVPPPAGVTTPFIYYPGRYTAHCNRRSGGWSYLEIGDVAGDPRPSPIDPSSPLLAPNVLGLHPFDYELGMDDLLRLVSTKIAAAP